MDVALLDMVIVVFSVYSVQVVKCCKAVFSRLAPQIIQSNQEISTMLNIKKE